MKIERKPHGVDEGDVFYVEPRHQNSLSKSTGRKVFRRTIPFVITAILAAGATLGIVKYTEPEHFGLAFALEAANGKVALTQDQLKSLVVGEGLTVYWLGPEAGALYALDSVNKNQNYVRYLPGGEGLADAGANFRVIGTYKAKDALSIIQNGSQLTNGSSGFTNSDGYFVSYNTVTHPLSAFVGITGTDYQVEIFDPVAGQAVILARAIGLIQKIG